MAAFYIALKRLPESAAAGLEGLQVLDLVCVDDLDSVAGNPAWERALFNCFNEVRSAGGCLLVSSRLPLNSLEFGLPDLASRLAWGVRLNLQSPNDDGKLQWSYHGDWYDDFVINIAGEDCTLNITYRL